MRFPTAALGLGFAIAELGVGLGLATTASAADTKEQPTPAGYVRTAETKNCLRVTQIRSSEILNRSQILFKMSGGEAYLNEPTGCPGLSRQLSLSYEVTNNELCTTTIVKLVDVSSPVPMHGTCSLAPFQKLEKKTAGAP